MDATQIERLIRRGGMYFAESLWEYWPSERTNELPERNISLHLARSFGEAGFASFAEVHTREKTDQRIDFLTYNPQLNTLLLAESKRLYSKAQLRSLLEDTQRILDFRPLETVSDAIAKAQRYGALLATTWDRHIATWWATDSVNNSDNEKGWPAGAEVFDNFVVEKPALKNLLTNASWGSLELQGFDQYQTTDCKHHYLLYAIFPAS